MCVFGTPSDEFTTVGQRGSGTAPAVRVQMSHPAPQPVVHLLANSRSGKGLADSIHEKVKAIGAELGYLVELHEVSEPAMLEKAAAGAVAAAEKDGGLVMAAGGDGTIRTVAEKVQGTNARFSVIPCGTFNYFARTHNIPLEADAAIRLGLTGECRPVRLGSMNGRIFLINASLGMYAQSIHEREKNTSRFGRHRIVALLSTVRTFLSDHLLLRVSMKTGEEQISMRTPMIFIGNNALQFRDLKMKVARCMKEDSLAVVAMKPLGAWEKFRVLARGALRTIEHEERLETFCIDTLQIQSHPRHQTVALDGEIFYMTSPFEIKAMPEVLRLMLPPREVAR